MWLLIEVILIISLIAEKGLTKFAIGMIIFTVVTEILYKKSDEIEKNEEKLK